MQKPKISSLLIKRDVDYNNMTEGVTKILGENLIKAIQFLSNKSRDMKIVSIDVLDGLVGFCRVKVVMYPNVGDIINTTTGAEIVITDDNRTEYLQPMEMLITLKALDSNSAYTMYKCLKDVDTLLKGPKENIMNTLIQYDTLPISEVGPNILDTHILDNPEFSNVLDILTAPEKLEIMGFDLTFLNNQQKNYLKIVEYMGDELIKGIH